MIQIHFYLPRTFFEKCVSFFGRTKYCHVAIQYGHVVVESTAGKGVIRRTNYQSEKSDLFFVFASKPNAEIDAWVNAQLGERYGYFDNAQTFFKKWLHWSLGGNPRGPTCVEFGIDLLRDMTGNRIEYQKGMTPDELIDEIHALHSAS